MLTGCIQCLREVCERCSIYIQIWLESANRWIRYCAYKQFWHKFSKSSPTVTLKIRWRSSKHNSSCPNVMCMNIWLKSAKWFVRYPANKHFWLKFGSCIPHWPWKSGQDHQNIISSSPCPNVRSTQIWLKSGNSFMRYHANKKVSC